MNELAAFLFSVRIYNTVTYHYYFLQYLAYV